MPSIHAILLFALGGVLGADPRDELGDRSAPEDPFAAQADYRQPTPRQPWTAEGGTSPPTVRLAQPPLPDFAAAGGNESREPGAGGPVGPSGGDDGAEARVDIEPAGGGFVGNTPPVNQWETGTPAAGTPPRGYQNSVQPISYETPNSPAAGEQNSSQPMKLPPPSGGSDALPRMLPTVAWP
ncbi:MAG TPA: hypothetical protein VMF30_01675, partial [Pirellulales bacterium]|nr:hypothetical protein [Pirellulales bacterium]